MDPRLRTAARFLVGLVGTASLGLAGVELFELWRAAEQIDHMLLAVTLFIVSWQLGFAVLALAIAWRGSPTVSIYFGGLFFAMFSAAWSLLVLLENPFENPFFLIWAPLSYSMAILFTQRFPEAVTPPRVDAIQARWFRILAARPLKALLSPYVFWPFVIVMEAIVHGTHIEILGLLHVLVWLTLAGAYLYVGYLNSDKEERSRLYWIFEAVLLMLGIEVVEFLLWSIQALGILEFQMRAFNAWLSALQGTVGLVCFGMAMFYAGAFDVRLVVQRTAVTGATATVVVMLFIAVEELLLNYLGDIMGFESQTAAVIGGVLAAMMFRPISNRVDRFIRTRR